jgi:hypothetical protein
MSKLVELFNDKKLYNRLNALPGDGRGNFNARNQSATDKEIRQSTAVDFFDTDAKIQEGFTVDEAANALSTTGIAKAVEADFTRFTDAALKNYEVRSVDPKLAIYKSKLIQRYLATNTNTQFATLNETSAGIKLVYSSQ